MSRASRERLATSLLHTLHENTKLGTAAVAAPPGRFDDLDRADSGREHGGSEIVALPAIESASIGHRLVDSIVRRRSIRRYRQVPMPLGQLGQLLFFGASPDLDPEGMPAADAVGSLVELYAVLWSVEGLAEGTYRYDRGRHELVRYSAGPSQRDSGDAVFQREFTSGTGILLLVADIGRAVDLFGPRGYRYALMQAGSMGEAFYLAATALGVGLSGNGGFRESTAQEHCGLDGIRRDLVWSLPFGPNEVVE